MSLRTKGVVPLQARELPSTITITMFTIITIITIISIITIITTIITIVK